MDPEKLVRKIRQARTLADVRRAEAALAKSLERTPVIVVDTVHFLFADAHAQWVSVTGDWNDWDPQADRLERLHAKSSIWYLKKSMPMDARFAYRLVVDGHRSLLDPGNPNLEEEVFGTNNSLSMPAYERDPYTLPGSGDVPRGRTRTIEIPNGYRNQEFARTVEVYIPHDVRSVRKLPVLYVHDGAEVVKVGRLPSILDNLYHCEPKLPRALVVMIPPRDRNAEYMLNAHYANWIARTLVPTVEGKLGIRATAASRGTTGASLGGLLSAQLGLIHPKIFGNIAVQSPAFWVQREHLIKQFARIKRLPLRWYMQTGTVNDAEEGTRKMLAVLSEKGYPVTYRESTESHNWANWRNRYTDILRWFVSHV